MNARNSSPRKDTDPAELGRGPLLVISLKEGIRLAGNVSAGDPRELATRVARLATGGQQGGRARCCLIAEDGTAYLVFRGGQKSAGFVLTPDQTLDQGRLAEGGQWEDYRSLFSELFSRATRPDGDSIRSWLAEMKILAAARLRGIHLSAGELADVVRLRAGRDGIEPFDPNDYEPPERRKIEKPLSGRLDLVALADDLWEGYSHADSRTAYSGDTPLPSREKVGEIIDGSLPVLFPGYYDHRADPDQRRDALSRSLSWLRERLADQIALAMRFRYEHEYREDDYRVWGEEKADETLSALPEIRAILDLDVRAALRSDPAAWDHHEIVATYPGILAVATYRLAHALEKANVPLIPRMMTERAHSQTGIDIHPGAAIGGGFFIDHGTGVVIGQTAVIGRDVTLYQGVTLGALNFPRDGNGELIRGAKRHPTIEDRVVVYSNASVLGGDTVVSRDSIIGANAWVYRSVPPESIVKRWKGDVRVEPRPKKQAADLPN